jgi:hypothetical protein
MAHQDCGGLHGPEVAGKFRHAEDFGPRTVRVFLEESAALGEMTPEQVQTTLSCKCLLYFAAWDFKNKLSSTCAQSLYR